MEARGGWRRAARFISRFSASCRGVGRISGAIPARKRGGAGASAVVRWPPQGAASRPVGHRDGSSACASARIGAEIIVPLRCSAASPAAEVGGRPPPALSPNCFASLSTCVPVDSGRSDVRCGSSNAFPRLLNPMNRALASLTGSLWHRRCSVMTRNHPTRAL